MTPSRVSPGSATSTVAHKKWSGAITAAAAPLLLVLALTGRADATCTVYVHNDYSYGLTIDAYNGWDGICGIPVLSFDVNGLGGCTLRSVWCFPVGIGCMSNRLDDSIHLTHMNAASSLSFSL